MKAAADHYPAAPGYVHDSQTSQQAAQNIKSSGKAAKQREFILDVLAQEKALGATGDELRRSMAIKEFPAIQAGTVSARLIELERSGAIVKTDQRRKTSTGNPAYVYKIGNGVLQYPFRPRRNKPKTPVIDNTKLMTSWGKLRREIVAQNDMLLRAAMHEFESNLNASVQG